MRTDDLSMMERDALTELVNVAVSGAAARLRAMVGSEVGLTVPVIDIMRADEAVRTLENVGDGRLVAVKQDFSGRIAGQTMLVFSEEDSEMMAHAVLGQVLPADYEELKDDTLIEMGNVLLLGFLAMIGSILSLSFEVTVPTMTAAAPRDLFQVEHEHVILVVYVNFGVREINARGYFSLLLGLGTFEELREIVNAYVRNLMEG